MPGGGERADVPRAAVRDVGEAFETEAGQAHLDGGEAADVLGVRAGEPEDGGAADVLAGEVHGADAEVLDELVQVFGRGGAVVVGVCGAGVAEAAQVDGEDPVAGGQQRDELVEGPPALREPVDEQDRRALTRRRRRSAARRR